jgi:hypothetical protein
MRITVWSGKGRGWRADHWSVDDCRSGQSSTVTCVEVKEQFDRGICDNSDISSDDVIASGMNISNVKNLCDRKHVILKEFGNLLTFV